MESEATRNIKSDAPVVEVTYIVVATPVPPETGNLHATLGIEYDDFFGEDNYGLDFLNLAADGSS